MRRLHLNAWAFKCIFLLTERPAVAHPFSAVALVRRVEAMAGQACSAKNSNRSAILTVSEKTHTFFEIHARCASGLKLTEFPILHSAFVQQRPAQTDTGNCFSLADIGQRKIVCPAGRFSPFYIYTLIYQTSLYYALK